MLEARNIEVRVGPKCLLSGVDLAVTPGRLVAVLGPNGAGKSTLLRALSGATRVARGTVSLDGKTLADWKQRDLARRRAVLPQVSFRSSFSFSARELVLLGRAPHRGAQESLPDEAVVEEALAAADASSLAERDIATLSGGEFQRVELARVLAQIWEAKAPQAPGYLLLDEPTASLDLVQQDRMLSLAQRLARQGFGVVAIVHDLTAALERADEALLLAQGRSVAQGTIDAVMRTEPLSQAFGAPLQRARLEGSQKIAILPA